MRVLLAFDKFKDSMAAASACAAARDALRFAQPEWTVESCPLADGGEGFAEILTTAAGHSLRSSVVTGPRGLATAAKWGLVSGRNVPESIVTRLGLKDRTRPVAVIEMAAASGLALLAPASRDVWRTSTLGTGELIRDAMAAGAGCIVMGVGGSATNDLGLGALSALGLRPVDASGRILSPEPVNWAPAAGFSGQLPELPPIRIACDVTNPLCGPRGAAAVYGPQKGLQAEDVERLDAAVDRMGRLLAAHFHRPDDAGARAGAGAAGGIAYGLMVAANAELVSGFELVSDWLELDRRISAADLVITGEGRFDESSLSGKGPGAVAVRALTLGKPVHVFAGAVTARDVRPNLHLHAITPAGLPLAQALGEGPRNLGASVAAAFAAAAR